MGKGFSKRVKDYISAVTNNFKILGAKRKREDDSESDSETSIFIHKTLSSPKRMKLMSTPQYVYQTFFKDGKYSDITLIIMGKMWNLHKMYLSQSPYFSSMFSGSWKESTIDIITIDVIDPRITLDSLCTVLGSVYTDEISLKPADVISTLATATLFQLDGIIQQCVVLMLGTVNNETAVKYYYTACEFGLQKVEKAAFQWLLVNLMLSHVLEHPNRLSKIDEDLMLKLVASPDLFVIQTEISVYTLLRYWMYLRIESGLDYGNLAGVQDVINYFKQKEEETGKPFLLTQAGTSYRPVFEVLRYDHLVQHDLDVNVIKTDKIIKYKWLFPSMLLQWLYLLRIDEGLDIGPINVSSETFSTSSLRCGRILSSSGDNVWRWTGFNFGVDLIWTCDQKNLKVKRQHRSDQLGLLSMVPKRHLVVRVRLASLDSQRQIKVIQSTGMTSLSLKRNEEAILLELDKDLTYPILVSINLLGTTPV